MNDLRGKAKEGETFQVEKTASAKKKLCGRSGSMLWGVWPTFNDLEQGSMWLEKTKEGRDLRDGQKDT